MSGKNKNNKKTINPEAIVNENGANAADNKNTEKNFYPDVEYNKSKRIKFFSLYALLFLTMGVTIGAFISIGQWWIAIFSLAVIIFIGCFIPQTIKSYPVKKGVPQITIANREVKIGGQTFHIQDVARFNRTCARKQSSFRKQSVRSGFCFENARRRMFRHGRTFV